MRHGKETSSEFLEGQIDAMPNHELRLTNSTVSSAANATT